MIHKQLYELEEINAGPSSNNSIEVTIYCNTYNQAGYLEDAIESFLNQKTDFDYEIIIFDDASTDGTDRIIRHYTRTYPRCIKALISKSNTYRNSDRVDFIRTIERKYFRGKYIAFCEGDDYWIDENKLQIQKDSLDSHPECDMCACWGCTVTADDKKVVSNIRPAFGDRILSTDEVILGGGQYLVSSGLFYRKSMREHPMNFEKVIGLDYAMQIRGSLRGGIYYTDKMMAVYRRFVEGSWTMRVLKNKENLDAQWLMEKKMLTVLDEETKGKYHEVIVERLKAYTTFYSQLMEKHDEVCELLNSINGKVFLWGLGRRGSDFERFCKDNQISLNGVCDITNSNLGQKTGCGNTVIHTDEVLENADYIIASNSFVAEDISKLSYKGTIINIYEYMPLG